MKAGEKLQKALRACARRPHTQDILIKFYQRISQPIQRRVFRKIPKGRFATGGLFIAIVGGDGAGKTTLIDELHYWFSEKFEIKKLHMGKPAWSLTTVLARGLLKIGTLLRLYKFEGDVYEESLKPHGIPWFIRAVCTARDRYLTYLQARRLSSNGSLVLCDRYSLPSFMNMDGPQCAGATQAGKIPDGLISFLSRLEAFYYQQIKLPDLIIVLKLNPEVAVQRKSDETEESVRARSTEVWELDWEKIHAQMLDARQSREEVLSAARQLIWSNL
jgi:thymidylate kinase